MSDHYKIHKTRFWAFLGIVSLGTYMVNETIRKVNYNGYTRKIEQQYIEEKQQNSIESYYRHFIFPDNQPPIFGPMETPQKRYFPNPKEYPQFQLPFDFPDERIC